MVLVYCSILCRHCFYVGVIFCFHIILQQHIHKYVYSSSLELSIRIFDVEFASNVESPTSQANVIRMDSISVYSKNNFISSSHVFRLNLQEMKRIELNSAYDYLFWRCCSVYSSEKWLTKADNWICLLPFTTTEKQMFFGHCNRSETGRSL